VSVLSAQTIKYYCQNHRLLTPWTDRGVVQGKSYGIGPCTYDVRISENIKLGPKFTKEACALASTIERFELPDNICAHVMDKSSWARHFLGCYNTHLDPGWRGYLTLELRNDTMEEQTIIAGWPIVQIKFEFLDKPTNQPYNGKYQDQESGPQAARYER
jgi:dCTP deaminase